MLELFVSWSCSETSGVIMCKEDVRLARAASQHDAFTAAAPAAAVQVLTANPNRYSLAAGIGVLTPLALNVSCMIAAKVGDKFIPLIGLSADHPTACVNLFDVGQLIVQAIWFLPAGSDPPTNLYVGDSAFDKDFEKV
jgi:hypothetical protein